MMARPHQQAQDPSALLGAKLLAGWTMLGESCPNGCETPLMENRRVRGGPILCVRCNNEFVRDEAGDMHPAERRPAAAAVPAAATTAAAATTTTTTTTAPRAETTAEGLSADEIERAMARNNAISAQLGEKLLQGWKMLADACPRPECYTPLMQDRLGKMWCLQCKTQVIMAEDFDPTKHVLATGATAPPASASSAPPAAAAAPAATTATPAAATTTTTTTATATTTTATPPATSAPKSRAAATAAGVDCCSGAGGTSGGGALPVRYLDGIDDALDAVFDRLTSATHSLTASRDVAESRALCGLIADAATALNALRQLPRGV